MHKCWERTAKVRPSFLIILDRCENFRRKSYSPGYDNQAFLGKGENTDDFHSVHKRMCSVILI